MATGAPTGLSGMFDLQPVANRMEARRATRQRRDPSRVAEEDRAGWAWCLILDDASCRIIDIISLTGMSEVCRRDVKTWVQMPCRTSEEPPKRFVCMTADEEET